MKVGERLDYTAYPCVVDLNPHGDLPSLTSSPGAVISATEILMVLICELMPKPGPRLLTSSCSCRLKDLECDFQSLGNRWFHVLGFPKIRGTFWGSLYKRIIVLWGLYEGPPLSMEITTSSQPKTLNLNREP